MIIVMRRHASEKAVNQVISTIRAAGLQEHLSQGVERTIIGIVGDERQFDHHIFAALPEVERAVQILHEWQIISREAQQADSTICVRGVTLGGEACLVRAKRVDDFRLPEEKMVFLDPYYVSGRPYEYLGSLNEKNALAACKTAIAHWHQSAVPVMVRVRDSRQIEQTLAAGCDVLYLGGEMMNNLSLAQEVGRLNTPLVLCKDKHHSVDDWLLAAERVALHGNQYIILGDEGTLSLSQSAQSRLDTEAIAAARALSHLPVLANTIRLRNAFLSAKILCNIALAATAQVVIIE